MKNEQDKPITIDIRVTDSDNDSDDVFYMVDGVIAGYGYRPKDSGKLRVTRCPVCSRENHAMAVISGRCAWCGFDASASEEVSTPKRVRPEVKQMIDDGVTPPRGFPVTLDEMEYAKSKDK